jgi:hypothetical protein
MMVAACSRPERERTAPGQDAPAGPQDQAPQATTRTLTATDLAWLGETADGIRKETLRLVVDKAGMPRLRRPNEHENDDREIAPVRTDALDRWRVDAVVVRPNQAKQVALETDSSYDAVFWSESSVDKFVWPYYHSHRLWNDTLQAVKDTFAVDRNAVAIAHQAPSKSSNVMGTAQLRVGVVADTGGPVTWYTASDYLRRRR